MASVTHVNIFSLTPYSLVNQCSDFLSQFASPCRTFESKMARRCGMHRSRTLPGKRLRRLVAPLKAIRFVLSKEDAYPNSFRLDASSIVASVDKPPGRNLATADPDPAPVLHSSNNILVKEPTGVIIDRDSPLKIIRFGPEPQSFPLRFKGPHDIGTFKRPCTLPYSLTNTQSEVYTSPLGMLGENTKGVAGAPSPTITEFNLSTGARVGDADQPFVQYPELRVAKAFPSAAANIEASFDPQLFVYLPELSKLAAILPAKLRGMDLILLALRDNGIWPASWGTGAYMGAAVRGGKVPRYPLVRFISILPRTRYTGFFHSTHVDRRAVVPLWPNHKVASPRIRATANYTRTINLASKPAGGFLPRIITTFRSSGSAKSPKGFNRKPVNLPLVCFIVCRFPARLRQGKLRALAPGPLSPHTLAWDPNIFAGSSGFNHAFDSGQAPCDSSPNLRNAGNMRLSSGSSLEPSYLATQGEDERLYNTTDSFGEELPGLSSTPSYVQTSNLIPQHPGLSPTRPVPLDGHGICERSFNAGYNHAISSGACMDDRTQLLPTQTPIHDRRKSRHPVATAPLGPRRQPVSILPPQGLQGPSYDAPNNVGPSFDTSRQSTNLAYTGHSLRNPWASRTTQQAHQPLGFNTFAGSILANQVPAVGRNPTIPQFYYDKDYSIPSDAIPTRVPNAPLPDLVGAIQPTPILAPSRSLEQIPDLPPRTCPVCNRIFRRPYLLKDHITSRHSQEKPYPCDYPGCASRYTTHSNMMRHRNKKHSPADNSTMPMIIPSADEESGLVGSSGPDVIAAQSASAHQHLTQTFAMPPVVESTFSVAATSVQQSAPEPSAPSTTDLEFLDHLLARPAFGPGHKWARGRRR